MFLFSVESTAARGFMLVRDRAATARKRRRQLSELVHISQPSDEMRRGPVSRAFGGLGEMGQRAHCRPGQCRVEDTDLIKGWE